GALLARPVELGKSVGHFAKCVEDRLPVPDQQLALLRLCQANLRADLAGTEDRQNRRWSEAVDASRRGDDVQQAPTLTARKRRQGDLREVQRLRGADLRVRS